MGSASLELSSLHLSWLGFALAPLKSLGIGWIRMDSLVRLGLALIPQDWVVLA